MKAIYKRELAAYAHSMTGCVATAFLLAVVGLYFMAYNLYQGTPGFATALNGVDMDNHGTALDRSGEPVPVPRVIGPISRRHAVHMTCARLWQRLTPLAGTP